MAYIGNSLTQQSFTGGMDQFNGNASNTTFGLTRQVNTPFDVNVYVEGVFQRPGVAYTVSANTITFTSAPSTGANNIVVVYENFTATSVVPVPGSVTPSSLAANTIQSALGYVPANIAGDTFTGMLQSNAGIRTTVANTAVSSFNGRTFINTNATGDSEIGGGVGSNYTDLMVNGSAVARLTATNLVLNNGQIKFPTTQIASSDANTLDDYEEGTWTPVLQAYGGGTNPTISYAVQSGVYTKIGRVVHVAWYIMTPASITQGTPSFISVGGLPFAVNNNQEYGCMHWNAGVYGATAAYGMTGRPLNNEILIARLESNGGCTATAGGNIRTSSYGIGSAWYVATA